MNCLGTNISEVRQNVKEGIQSILQNNGGALNADNSVDLGNININEFKEYINEAFGTTEGFLDTAPWLIEKSGKIYYQFPESVEDWTKKSLEKKEIREKVEYETAMQLALENEIAENLKGVKESEPNNLLFSLKLVKYDNEEVTEIIKENGLKSNANTSTDFKGWVAQKLATLQNLKKDFENFKRTETKGTQFYRDGVAQYQNAILNFKKTITDLEKTEITFEDVYADVIQELEYLDNIVDRMDNENIDAYNLERRLDVLSKLFLNKNLNDKDLEKPIADSNVFLVYKSELLPVRDKLNDLIDKYDKKSFNKVAKLLSDNALVKQLKEQDKLEVTHPETGEVLKGDEALDFLLKLIEEAQTGNMNWFSERLLGANWQGIFGQIARLTQEIQIIEERGKVESGQKVIRDNLTDFHKSGLTVEIFKAKDEYGVANGYLAHKFSSKWFKYDSAQRKIRDGFNNLSDFETKSIDYKKWANNKKDNEITLDFTKIKSIKDKFYGSFLYREGFVSTDNEMESYEAEMREILGDFMFEDKIKEQINKLEDYEVFYINNHTDFEEEVGSVNPLSFLSHHNSNSYSNPSNGIFYFSDYNVSFPINKKIVKGKEVSTEMYSKDFETIENNKAAFNIWKALEEAYRERINPELRESGYKISEEGLDLAMIEDYMKSVLYTSLDGKGKGKAHAINLWNKLKDLYMPTATEGQGATDVKTPYSNTLRSAAKQMANSLKKNNLDNLIELASKQTVLNQDSKENNKTILDEDGIKYINDNINYLTEGINKARDAVELNIAENKLKSYILSTKNSLASSIANARVYSNADLDILKVTQALDNTTAIAKANRKSLNSVRLLENFLRVKAGETKDNERSKNLDRMSKFLNIWIDNNILNNINVEEFNIVQRITGYKFSELDRFVKTDKKSGQSKFKTYTKVEKELIDFLKNEVKNIDDKDDFTFKEDIDVYEKKGGRFTVTKIDIDPRTGEPIPVVTNIEKAVFEEHYASYIGEKITKMGTPFTLGGMLMSFIRIKAINSLALNIPAGVMNRNFGAAINRVIASSGRYGITLEQLMRARNAMSMSNIDRYLTEGIGLKRGSREEAIALNMKTLKLFANAFGMVQNKLNEIDGLNKFSNKEGFSMMDWAINFAEWRNQGELILSEMMNHFLEYQDENGNTIKVPIYDMETEQYIYKPGTLTLRDEYRTEENIRIWENFSTSNDGNNTFLPLIINARANIERSQGNYNNSDKPMVMASQVGRAVIMFKRFMAEQFANQFGKIDYDLIKGGKYYEGRYRALIKSTPATAIVLGSLGFGIGGIYGLLAIPISIGASKILQATLKEELRVQELEAMSLLDQLKLSLDLIHELLLRTLERPTDAVIRFAEMTSKEKGKNLRKKQEQAWKKMIEAPDRKWNYIKNKEQRAIWSESIQDISNLYWSAGVALSMVAVLRFLGEMLTGADDDDDEKTYKEKMENIERICNLITNRFGFFASDFTRSFVPSAFVDDVQPMLLNNIRFAKKSLDKGGAWLRGEGDFKPFASDLQRALPTVIPNQVSDIFLKNKMPWEDPKIYVKPVWYKSGHQETNAKTVVTYHRKKLTEDMVDIYKEKFVKELEAMPQNFQDNFSTSKYQRNKLIEELANTAVEKEKRKLYTRRNQETFEEFQNRINLKEAKKKWNKGEIKPKYTFMEIYNQQKEKDLDNEKERLEYEKEFKE